MGFYSQSLYRDFEKYFLKNVSSNSGMLVVTLPGLGAYHFVKKIIEKNKVKDISYIKGLEGVLKKHNILDLDFVGDKNALNTAVGYFRKVNEKVKFSLIVNRPSVVEFGDYLESVIPTHIYSTYYFPARDRNDTNILSKEFNGHLNKVQLERIWELGGGIGRISKFLALNEGLLSKSILEVMKNRTLTNSLAPTFKSISECSEDVLLKLNIKKDGKFCGGVVEKYFELNKVRFAPVIKIFPDFSFEEAGVVSNQRLTIVEKNILDYLLQNDFVIEKERIADIKWGEGSYDKYSDQAIIKMMVRLGKKLQKYKLVSLRGRGYKLQ